MKLKYQVLTSKKKNFFFPENYPDSVRKTYLGYMNYNMLMQFTSSALGVLSTQQLLLALGADSLTASAALNWIIKDGIGQLGGVIYAGTTGNQFDENPKFYKWISAFSLNISCLIELLTPLFPGYFLPLASIGTMGKNISAISGSASRAAIHLHMCKENNLADLTAKSSTQTTASCLLGTFFGSLCGYYSTTYWVGASFFLGFSIVHLLSCYKGIGYIELNTLNIQRLDILLEEYEKTGKIMTTEEVAKRERIAMPYKGKVVIGSMKVFEKYERFDKCIVALDGNVVNLVYEENAGPKDMILGYVKAKEMLDGKVYKIGSLEDLEVMGWNVRRPFLSPNNTRIRFLDEKKV